MKILIVRNFPSYFSVQNNTYNIQEIGLAKALIRKGHICDIAFWTDRNEETVEYNFDSNTTIKIFYRRGKTALKNTFLRVDDIIDNYDVIQLCEYNQIQSWIFAKKYSDKTIIYHGPYYSEFNKNYNRMCKLFDAMFLWRYKVMNTPFIVKSKLAKSFLEAKGLTNVVEVGVGIDAQILNSSENKCNEPIFKSIKEYSGLKLLYIGRLEPRRNIEFLFRLLANLRKNCEAELFIIGDGDKEYIDNIFTLVRELHIENYIIWQKKIEQKNMSNVYKMADYFLLPTHYEIFGMVLLEAMYFKNVVLTTENGGSSTLISNKKNGFILHQNDLDEWINTIRYLENNPSEKKKIGIEANKIIEESFTWDKLVDRFIESYRKVGNE